MILKSSIPMIRKQWDLKLPEPIRITKADSIAVKDMLNSHLQYFRINRKGEKGSSCSVPLPNLIKEELVSGINIHDGSFLPLITWSPNPADIFQSKAKFSI